MNDKVTSIKRPPIIRPLYTSLDCKIYKISKTVGVGAFC